MIFDVVFGGLDDSSRCRHDSAVFRDHLEVFHVSSFQFSKIYVFFESNVFFILKFEIRALKSCRLIASAVFSVEKFDTLHNAKNSKFCLERSILRT